MSTSVQAADTDARRAEEGSSLARSWRRLLPALVWGVALAVGAYVRWANIHLAEFGPDQMIAINSARQIRRGLELPLVGLISSVGPRLGAGEFYVMLPPQFISDSPELSTQYIGLLHLVAAAWFTLIVWRYLGAWTAAATMLLFATAPWAIHYGRKIWSPDSLPFFGACIFYCLLEGLAWRRRWAIPLACFLAAFATQVHYSALPFPAIVLVALALFWRRLRRWQLPASLLAFVVPLLPYVYYTWQHDIGDFARLLAGGTGTARVDLAAFEVLQILVSGAEYVEGLGATYPAGSAPVPWPWAEQVLQLSLWLGVLVVAFELWRGRGDGELGPAGVVRALALVWVLVPLLLTVRHSFDLLVRYDVPLLPVVFLFPAACFAALPSAVGRLTRLRWQVAGDAVPRAAGLLAALLLLYCAGAGLWRFAAVQATLGQARFPLAGPYDCFSPPIIAESRYVLDQVEGLAQPGHELVITGGRLLWEAAPLSYLSDGRHPLRLNHSAGATILPANGGRLLFLPDSLALASIAAEHGGTQQKWAMPWPPDYTEAVLVEADRFAIPPGFTAGETDKVLANGLALAAYKLMPTGASGLDLLTVWRVVRPEWGKEPYTAFNLFAHVFDVAGREIAVKGEVELPGGEMWGENDLIVAPLHLEAEQPLARGLYRAELGVYVRKPERAPLPAHSSAVATIDVGGLRLGVQAEAPTQLEPVAELDGIRLVIASASRVGDRMDVELVWQAPATPAADYTVFAHVYDNSGKLVAQHDGWPGGGIYPASAWLPGEYVVDKRSINLPAEAPGGPYTVRVGLYDARTMERLAPNPDHGDRTVVIAELE